MSRGVHYFRCEYDDLYKFEWPVVLDEQLNLWLDVICLREIGLTTNVDTRKLFSFGNQITEHQLSIDTLNKKVIGESLSTAVDEKSEFCKANDLITLTNLHDNHKTVIKQFLYQQLPYYIDIHLNNIHLMSLFDVTDYWNFIEYNDKVRKYWLFRLKIVVMKFENEKHKPEDPDSKKGAESENQKLLCEKIYENVKLQLSNLNTYKEVEKIHVMRSFLKLLKGSVGLLEILLQWN
ncbi:unknown [Cryptophlebia leucotreta granulovirus]|uniref:Uncharacterized protein n=1 Tax=Cryptophlebia leucotreta granulosis virus TaxID=35254 RepID=Q7T5Q7_GVCL|nr:hypothetical protein [Cryptophlebia leucotreta granulovirus]AAQ21627.1 unknown [Cryptophlebia leucotreta granulovirus]